MEIPTKKDVILEQVRVKQQWGSTGLMTSILEPITLDLSEINITSLYSLFLDCVQNKCLQFVLLLVAATKKKKLRVYRCT